MDPYSSITSYNWDFGDGSIGLGLVTSHTYELAGNYLASLRITCNKGTNSSTTHAIIVTQPLSEPRQRSALFFDDFEDELDPAPLSEPRQRSALFFDDFEDELDPAWATTSSSWKDQDGTYTFNASSAVPRDKGYVFVVTGKDWTGYTVEADVWVPDYGRHAVGIILLAQEDLNSLVIVWINPQALYWEVIENRKTIVIGEPVLPGLLAERWQHVAVGIDGSTYKVYVEGVLRSTFSDSRFTQGFPGVAAMGSASVSAPLLKVDNFEVIPH